MIVRDKEFDTIYIESDTNSWEEIDNFMNEVVQTCFYLDHESFGDFVELHVTDEKWLDKFIKQYNKKNKK